MKNYRKLEGKLRDIVLTQERVRPSRRPKAFCKGHFAELPDGRKLRLNCNPNEDVVLSLILEPIKPGQVGYTVRSSSMGIENFQIWIRDQSNGLKNVLYLELPQEIDSKYQEVLQEVCDALEGSTQETPEPTDNLKDFQHGRRTYEK